MVSGTVALEGKGILPAPVEIRAGCNGTGQASVYTTGRFSVQLGHSNYTNDSNPVALLGCEVRAMLSGYHTAVASVDVHNSAGTVEIGALILRRLDGVQGFTYSISTALAPNDARKAFERGTERAARNRLDEARKEFEKAVGIYPKYAVAWFELGVVQHRQGRIEDARHAYRQAMQADDRFLKPGLQLAMIAAAERKWSEVLALTARTIQLNPVEFPQAFLYSAAANYNLSNLDAAEQQVRRAIELDAIHQLPKAHHLLGVVLADRGDLTGAAQQLRMYLKLAPKAADAADIQRRLSEIERLTPSNRPRQQFDAK
jgi:tetratricopeptide (TPR) repeat protein